MLTVKLKTQDCEEVFEAELVRFVEGLSGKTLVINVDKDTTLEVTPHESLAPGSLGKTAYIMNRFGSTVATYHI